MKRRDFIKTAAVTGAIAITHPILANSSKGSPEPPPPAFELDEVTISELQEGMASGKFTARSLC